MDMFSNLRYLEIFKKQLHYFWQAGIEIPWLDFKISLHLLCIQRRRCRFCAWRHWCHWSLFLPHQTPCQKASFTRPKIPIHCIWARRRLWLWFALEWHAWGHDEATQFMTLTCVGLLHQDRSKDHSGRFRFLISFFRCTPWCQPWPALKTWVWPWA